MAEPWKGRPEGVMASGGWYGDYGNIGWNTRLRLRDYRAGPLLYAHSTWEQYNAKTGNTLQIHCLRLSALGEQFYREFYLEVEASAPDE